MSVQNQTAPAYERGAATPPLIEKTIGAFFEEMAARQPDSEALVSRHQRIRYTYAELRRHSRRLASALLQLGLRPGDRVGIWSHNNAEWLLMQLATAMTGIVLVNINPAYRTVEVEYALNKVGCTALVTMAHSRPATTWACCASSAPRGFPTCGTSSGSISQAKARRNPA